LGASPDFALDQGQPNTERLLGRRVLARELFQLFSSGDPHDWSATSQQIILPLETKNAKNIISSGIGNF